MGHDPLPHFYFKVAVVYTFLVIPSIMTKMVFAHALFDRFI